MRWSHSRRRIDFHRTRRQTRSGASREVWSPTALAGCGALSGGCQPSGRSRFGVFTAGPRAIRRPKSTASARAVLRSRRAWVGVAGVADGFGVLARFRRVGSVGREPITSRAFEHPSVCGNRCGRDRCSAARSSITLSTSAGAGSRLPGSTRIIRRGRFSHAAFRTRPSNLRDLAGRSGFFPLSARRRSWGFALRRVAPDLGWTTRGKPRGSLNRDLRSIAIH